MSFVLNGLFIFLLEPARFWMRLA